MLKNFLLIIIAVVFVAAACAVPVYADDGGHSSGTFSDFDDSHFNPVHNSVEALSVYWSMLRQLHNGEITFSQFVERSSDLMLSNLDSDVSGLLNDIHTNIVNLGEGYDFVHNRSYLDLFGNLLRSYLSDNGGSVSDFPLNDGGYWQVGNFTFKPYNFLSGYACTDEGFVCDGPWQSFSQPFSGVGVYYPDGTKYSSYVHGRAFGSPGTSQSLSIIDIQLSYGSDFVTAFVTYTISYSDGVSHTYKGQASVFIYNSDWGDYIGDDTINITDTSNVNGLSDDDLIKYIDNLIDKLENTFPDLSTIEGKLQEIINKLDRLDGNGLDFTDLMLALNTLVDLINSIGETADSLIPDELISVLTDLLDTITQNGGSLSQTDLTPVIDKIDELQKELLKAYAFNYSDNDIKSVTSKYDVFADYLIGKKFAFIKSLTSIIDTAVSAYKSSGNQSSFTVVINGSTHTIDLAGAVESEQLDLFRYMIAAFLYFKFALATYRRIPAYINNGGDE